MRNLSNILLLIALAALGYWGLATLRTQLYQTRELKRFEREGAPVRKVPDATPPEGPAKPSRKEPPRRYAEVGSPVAMIEIPRVGLSAVVVEGAGHRELDLGPGHIPGTPMPGSGGNVGIAGHRDTVFRPLRFLRRGDAIHLTAEGRRYRYQVLSVEIVEPRDVRVLYSDGRDVLTLLTCYPFYHIGAAPKRFVVHADCVNCPHSGNTTPPDPSFQPQPHPSVASPR